jgi:hypothetical protein
MPKDAGSTLDGAAIGCPGCCPPTESCTVPGATTQAGMIGGGDGGGGLGHGGKGGSRSKTCHKRPSYRGAVDINTADGRW